MQTNWTGPGDNTTPRQAIRSWSQTIYPRSSRAKNPFHRIFSSLVGLLILITLPAALLPAYPVEAALTSPPTAWTNFTWQTPLYNGFPVYDYQTSADPSNGGTAVQPNTVDIASGALAGTLGPGTQPSYQMAYYDGGTPGNANLADDYMAFRMRLSADPQNPVGSGYTNYDWCVLLDIDNDGWKEFVIDLHGNYSGNGADKMYVYYNNDNSNLVAPATDQIEEYYAASSTATGNAQLYNHTRVVSPATGGADNTQVWLDMQIPLTALRNGSGTQMVYPTSSIGIFLSTSASNIDPLQKDWMLAGVNFATLPIADLVITKTDSQDPIYPGGTLVYTLNVTNNGPSAAVNVVVTESYPAGFTYSSASPAPDSGFNNRWSFSSLAAGATRTITITGTISASGGTLSNSATVTSATNDSNYANNTATETTQVVPRADLVITKSDSPDPVYAGSTLTYTLQITNNGPNTAQNVVVTETYPAGFSFVSAVPPATSSNNQWTFASLANATTQTITITGTVSATGGSLTNTAAVSATTSDPNSANNSVNQNTTVIPVADLAITKTDSVDPVYAGDNLVYTLTVTNHGPSPATGVVVTENYPAGFTFVSADPAPDSGFNNRWTFASLASGTDQTITINGTVNAATGTLNNSAAVLSAVYDPVSGNNSATQATTVTPAADLAITKTDSPDPVAEGRTLTYTLTITNLGPSTAAPVVVTETYPDNFSFVSAVPAPDSGFDNRWTFSSLVAAGQETITITGTVSGAGVMTNQAAVSSGTHDINAANNTAFQNTSVAAVSDLSITKSASEASVYPGDNLTYTLTVTNHGPSDAGGVVVTESYPAGFTFLTADPAPDSGFDNQWTFANLAVGDNLTITITGEVGSASSGVLTNQAGVISDNFDPVEDNNTDYSDTPVIPAADLAVFKSDSPDPVYAGDNLTYTITVTNYGPSSAQNVVVEDLYPAGFSYLSADPAPDTGTNRHWTFASIAAGDSEIILVNGTVTAAGGSLHNSVSLSANTYDPQSDNNTVSQDTTVNPSADLVITKIDSVDPVRASNNLTYTLTVFNHGPSSAENLTVTESYPAGFSFLYAVPAPDSGFDNQWSFDNLSNSGSLTITITGEVTAGSGSLANSASVSADTHDPDSGNNSALQNTAITPVADIGVLKSASPGPIYAGDNFTYTLTVTNHGPSPDSNVVVTETYPTAFTFLSADPAPDSGFDNRWTFANLAVDESRVITITGYACAGSGPLFNSVEIDSQTLDPVLDNNTAGLETPIAFSSDLAVTKTDSPDPVAVGRTLTYTLTVTNYGPCPAANVVASDTYPDNFTFLAAIPEPDSGFNNQWTFPSLVAGDHETITITGTVDGEGPFSNQAFVSSDYHDPDSDNNTATEETTVNLVSDLQLVKTAAAEVYSGDNLTYILTVTNHGPSPAANVVVTDTYPDNFTFLSADPSPDSGYNNQWTLTTLTVGDNQTITISGAVTAASGVLTNIAAASSDSFDPHTDNNTDFADTEVIPSADLAVVKSAVPDPVFAGEDLTYTIVVTNYGPSPAENVVVEDLYPSGFSYLSADPVPDSGTNRRWTFDEIPAGSSENITVTITGNVISTGGSITNTVSLTSDTFDPETDNNTFDLETGVTPSADLSIFKIDTPDPVFTGENLTYTINVFNSGPSLAQNITVSESYPAGFTFLTADPAPDSGFNNQWTLDNLSAAGSLTILISGQVNAPSGSLSNTAAVSADTHDPHPADNSATQNTTVTPSADITVVKSSSPGPIYAGDNFTYTLTVTNYGPSPAQNVLVEESYPAAFTFLAADPAPDSGFENQWTLASLAIGDNQTITITGTAGGTAGIMYNNVEAHSSVHDPDADNNTDSLISVLTASADLVITKSDNPDPVYSGDNLTYILTVTNQGPDPAPGVVVTETYPAGFNFVSSTPDPDPGYNNRWTFSSLSTSGHETIIITGQVSATGGSLNNSVTVSSSLHDPDSGNNSAVQTTGVTAVADLSILKSDSPDPVNAGENVTYTLTVSNYGPSPASGVVVTETYGDNFTFISADPDPDSGFNNRWTFDNITAYGTENITITGSVPDSSSILNRVTVSGTEYDPATDNNTAVEETTILSSDLEIFKSDSSDPVASGDNLTYTLTVLNNSAQEAGGVVVTESYPAGFTFLTADPAPDNGTDNQWSLDNITGSGGSATITITGQVTAVSGTISNSASVTSSGEDPNPHNNSAVEETEVTAVSDLEITKSDSPDPVYSGDNLTYTLIVTNHGPSPAENVLITETYPSGFVFLSADPAPDSGTNHHWTLDNLTVDSPLTITITGEVSALSGSLHNTAGVTSDSDDPQTDNNTVSQDTAVNPSADLVITKIDSVDPVRAGNNLTYALTIFNHGPSSAENLTVSESYPVGFSFLYAVPAPDSGFDNQWSFDNLSNSGSLTITITGEVTAGSGTLANSAAVSADTHDPDSGNNSALQNTSITPAADIGVLKSAGPGPIYAGDNFTYTLTVTNHGPSPDTNVVVTETYPAAFTFLTADPAPDSGFNNQWTFANLAVDESRLITITGYACAGSGPLFNSVEIDSPTFDPVPDNNTAGLQTTIDFSSDLAVTKTDSPDPVAVGRTLTYTLTVTNYGPCPAANVVAADTYPDNFTFLSAIPEPDSGFDNQWTFPSLVVGDQVTITITGTVDGEGPFTNQAAVSSDYHDPQTDNNTDTEDTTITPSSDLLITKNGSASPVYPGDNLTYTLTVTNHGPSPAANVVVTEAYPTGFTFLSADPAPDTGFDNRWTFAEISVDGNRTILITGQVDSEPGHLINRAETVSDSYDPFTDNNSAELTTHVDASADLAVVKSAVPDPVFAGEDLTYTIVVTNYGPSPAENVVVNDLYPSGFSFVSADPAPDSGTNRRWTFDSIPAGSSENITVTISGNVISTGGSITNTVSLTSETHDPETDNNTFDLETGVTPSADLSIFKIDTPDPVFAGENLTYTLNVFNSGPSLAQNITVSESYPAGFTFLTADPAPDSGFNNQWTFDNLSAAGSLTILITGQVSAPSGSLSNSAAVSADTHDPHPADNSATQNTTVTPSADIAVVKSSSPGPIYAGDNFTYTLTVTNYGPSPAQNVLVEESYPAAFTFLTADPAPDSGFDNQWTLASLAAGDNQTITITGTACPEEGPLINQVEVDSPTFDSNPDNNTYDLQTPVTPASDLEITKSDSPDPVAVGRTLTYTLNVINHGPCPAEGVVVTETYPDNFTFLEADPDPDSGYDNRWTFASLAAAGLETITITGTVTEPGTLTNHTVVTSENHDPESGNNSTDQDSTVIYMSDLSIVKSASAETVYPGDNLTYTLTITNLGPNPASGVTVNESYPAGFTFLTADPDPDFGFDNQWTLASLAAGDNQTITITGRVEAEPGHLINSAVAALSNFDPHTDNNTASNLTHVDPLADLEVVKTADPDPVYAGESLTYTLTVTNHGPNTATGVEINDLYPAGFAFISADPAPDSGTNRRWTFASIAAGASENITVSGTVIASGGVLTNTVSLAAETHDPETDNNSYEQITGVTPSADLLISKSADPDPVHAGDSLVYTLEIFNHGPSSAENITVTEEYPAGFAFISADPAPDSGYNNQWTFDNLTDFGTQTITISGLVTALSGTLSNTAEVVSDTHDPESGNNSVEQNTEVIPSADIGVTKSGLPDPVYAGDILVYSLTVTNHGPSPAENVVVTENYPAGFSFSSADPNPDSGYDNRWTLAELADAESRTITISGTVIEDTGTLINTVEIRSATDDPDEDNNTASLETTITPSADLEILKSVSPDPAQAGNTLTYTLSVTNLGLSRADDVVVTEDYPDNFTYLTASPVPDSGYNNRWTFASLSAGAVQTITITGEIGELESITNQAWGSTSVRDPDSGNNTDIETTDVIPQADLTIQKSSSVEIVDDGDTLVYTLTITNLGPGNAAGVVVTEIYAAEFSFTAADPQPDSGYTNRWTCADIGAGDNLTITIQGTVNSPGGVLNNTATVEYANDPNLDNNLADKAIVVTSALPVAFKTVSLAADNNHDGMASPGDVLAYTIVIHNEGSATARDLTLLDTPDAHTTLVVGSVTTTQGTVTRGNQSGDSSVEVALGDIASGATATVFFEVTINLNSRADHIVNQAQVLGSNFAVVQSDNPSTDDKDDPTSIPANQSHVYIVPGLQGWGSGVLVLLLALSLVLTLNRRKKNRISERR